jgi:hypothetical protein
VIKRAVEMYLASGARLAFKSEKNIFRGLK